MNYSLPGKVRKLMLAAASSFLVVSAAKAQVSVTATGGTATASYTTVNAAFAAINAGTHQGAIAISITGNTTEPSTMVPLLKSATPSSYTSVTITPSGGNWIINSAAAPASNRGVIELAGADNVTIDGDDPATTGTRNLTIQAASVTTSGVACIRLSSNSTSGTDGADNITVKNCVIIGSRSSLTSTTNNYGIQFSDGISTSAVGTGAYGSLNTLIQNNKITKCYYAIHAIGSSSSYLNTGLQILNNVIGSSTASDYVAYRAIDVSYTATTPGTGSALIQGNDATTGFSSGPATMSSIELATANAGAKVNGNYIHDCINPTSSVWGMYGVGITSATSNDAIRITNNIIRDMTGYATSTLGSQYGGVGVGITAAATNIVINNNTIAQLSSSSRGTCILFTSSGATTSQILNNILVNNVANTAGSCIYTAATGNISGATVNNNDYYVTSPAIIGYYSASQATFTAWKAATNKDQASLNENPVFVSTTDLHIAPSVTPTTLESGGAPATTTGVTTDFDGQARPGPAGSINGGASNPDIGADEFDGVPLPACNGAPTAGTASGPSAICASIAFNVTLTGYSTNQTGISIQWESSPSGAGMWTAITGATNPTYSISSGITASTDYHAIVTCINGGGTDVSAPAVVNLNPFYNCYCTPVSACVNEGIENVTFSTINNSSNFCLNSSGYTDYSSVSAPTVLQGDLVNISVTAHINSSPASAGVWIDFNHNSQFDASEYTSLGSVSVTIPSGGTTNIFSGVVAIPAGASTGTTRMRVRSANQNGIANTSSCITSSAFGEFEDYLINIDPGTQCAAQPTAGAATSSQSTVACSNAPFVLSATGYTAGVIGLSFQWQESTNGTTFTNIGNATTNYVNDTVTGISQTKYYRLEVSCTAGSTVGYSNVVTVTFANYTAPWTEGFEGVTSPGAGVFPSCWTQQTTSGTNTPGTTTTNDSHRNPRTGTTYLYSQYSNTAWVYTPGFSLQANTSYDFSFFMMNKTVTSPVDFTMDVAYGTSPTSASMTNSLQSGYVASNGSYQLFTYTFTPAATGVYYFGIKSTSTSFTPWYLSFDDFKLDFTPSCIAPTNLTAANTTATGSTVNWAASTTVPGVGYDYYVSNSSAAPAASVTPYGSVGPTTLTANVGGLTPGTTNYVFVRTVCSATDKSAWSAPVTVNTIPGNDDCANAVVLTQSATCNNVSGTTASATLSMAATPCSGNPDDDVWYSFVATATDAQVALSNVVSVVGSSTDMYFQVLSGACGSMASLLCSDPNTGIVGGLTVGQTYYIRVYTFGAGNGNSFNICVTTPSAAPSCATLSSPATNATVLNTPTLSWNSATNASAYDIYLDGNTTPTTLFATVYNNGTTSYAITTPLAPGNYYWYVVAKNSAGAATGCATNTRKFIVAPTPVNDNCANATLLTQSTTCNNVSGTTAAGTLSMAATPCNGTPDDDVWYSFVATSTDASIALTNISSVIGNTVDMYFQVLSGSCGNFTSLLCSDPESATVSGLTVGQTYYIRVYTYGTGSGSSFDICVTSFATPPACASLSAPANNANATSMPVLSWSSAATATSYDVYLDGNTTPTTLIGTTSSTSFPVTSALAPGNYYWYVVAKNGAGAATGCATNTRMFTVGVPPANDECVNAVLLVQGTTCTNTPGATVGATMSMAATPCGGTPDEDVWFKFVATAIDAQVALSNIKSIIGNSTDMYFQVLSGNCGSQTSLLCNDPNTGTVGGLVVGQTYYIRVYTWGTNSADSFNICVTSQATAPTSCGTMNNPALNATTGPNPTITWNSVTNATSYDLYLDQNTVPTTLIANVAGTSYTVPTALNSGDYYWYIVPKSSAGSASGCNTNARKFTVVGPPVNDPCANAINISNQLSTPGTTVAATQSMPSGSCATSTLVANDVWYYFTTGSTGNVTVTATNTAGDVVLEVLSGTCGAFTQLDCQDVPAIGTETAVLSNLAPGTYYVRVYGYLTSETAFNIQVTGSPLAIKLTEISAMNSGARNRINWSSASEMRGDYFELERSSDGSNFTKIATMNAKGEASSYTYWDETPLSGANHYRLKLLSVTGEIGYSKVVTANVTAFNSFNVEAYPNPFSDKLTVRLSGSVGDHANVSITDVTGKVLQVVPVVGNTTTVDMKGFAAGIYILNYSDSEHHQTIKVSKQ